MTDQSAYLFKPDDRSDADILSSLLENGIGSSFDLRDWSERARKIQSLSPHERLILLLEPVRTDVAKLITMKALENDDARKHLVDECVYGEISIDSFENLLREHLPPTLPNDDSDSLGGKLTFYDLGSGTGKNVFLAALTGLFKLSVGIEIMPELSCIGEVLNESFKENIVGSTCSSSSSSSSSTSNNNTKTEFRCGSFLKDVDWVNADVVFCNCVMFDKVTMSSVASLSVNMKKNAIFITVGQDLLSHFKQQDGSDNVCIAADIFEIVETYAIAASWSSDVEMFIQKRI
jgi:SAM-dependent methyltransferase